LGLLRRSERRRIDLDGADARSLMVWGVSLVVLLIGLLFEFGFGLEPAPSQPECRYRHRTAPRSRRRARAHMQVQVCERRRGGVRERPGGVRQGLVPR